MMSSWRALRRGATGKRKTHLYPKCDAPSQLQLSVKLAVSVRGYFDCVKLISMAVSDKPGAGFFKFFIHLLTQHAPAHSVTLHAIVAVHFCC
jgi:hypothetical protein